MSRKPVLAICLVGLLSVGALSALCISKAVFSAQEMTGTSSVSQPVSQNSNTLLPTPSASSTFSLLFFGDMMFDRGVRTQIKKIGEDTVFKNFTKELASQYDLTIANLEGPVTSSKSKLVNSAGTAIPGFTFTFPTSTATLLRDSGVDIVSLANNHTQNFGQSGLKETASWLDKANVNFFGNPTNTNLANTNSVIANSTSTNSTSTNLTGANTNLTGTNSGINSISKRQCYNQDTICITFIGWHEFANQNNAEVIKEIKRAKNEITNITGKYRQSDLIIIMPHWGIEYKNNPSKNQIALAHTWIDAGADMIVGSHPHVIEPIEIYKDKLIFYSLGNYMFDQYFSFDTTHGLAVGMTYSLDPLEKNLDGQPVAHIKLNSIKLIPIEITGTKLQEISETNKNSVLKKLENISSSFLPKNKLEQIRSGEINF